MHKLREVHLKDKIEKSDFSKSESFVSKLLADISTTHLSNNKNLPFKSEFYTKLVEECFLSVIQLSTNSTNNENYNNIISDNILKVESFFKIWISVVGFVSFLQAEF